MHHIEMWLEMTNVDEPAASLVVESKRMLQPGGRSRDYKIVYHARLVMNDMPHDNVHVGVGSTPSNAIEALEILIATTVFDGM